MERFTVNFTFIENGHSCKTCWVGYAKNKEEAIKISKAWFGFDVDGIEITNIEVQ